MAAPHSIDTKNPQSVAAMVKTTFGQVWPKAGTALIDRMFADVTGMFTGKYPGYQSIDMLYHDFEHTLQASVCLVHLLEGRHRSGDAPVLNQRDWELALMAVLLHDSGFLKQSDDLTGTGAKYTLVHERRSCEFARRYLPGLGVGPAEINDVCSAIMCTGPQNRISSVPFGREEARLITFMLVTADYLAQMSAPDYVGELPILFREFQEAYDFEQMPAAKRPYHVVDDLLQKTPAFWGNYVRPMLDFEAGGVHRYLTTAGQPNPYIQAVEANIEEVRRGLGRGTGPI